MAEMNKEMTFVEKLIAIQTELKAPKDLRNNFGGYNYRSAESILEAVKPLLAKYGCLLTMTDDIITMGDKEDLRFYVKATTRFTDGKDEITTTAFAREPLAKKGSDESQITGAASSYARKYALNSLFCIDDTKDSDTTNQGDGDSEIAQARQYIAKALGKLPPETDTSKYDGYKTETDLNKLRAIYKEINTLYLGGK